MFEWDPRKAVANLKKHGIGFDVVELFDWDTAIFVEDDREDYGEPRYVAFGVTIEGKAYAVVYTLRGENIRIISIRSMNKRERTNYEQEIKGP
ncbi:MAG: BrnT family toxin [Cucumibacter sp.]